MSCALQPDVAQPINCKTAIPSVCVTTPQAARVTMTLVLNPLHLSIATATHLAGGLVGLAPGTHDEGIIYSDADHHLHAQLLELLAVAHIPWQVGLQQAAATC